MINGKCSRYRSCSAPLCPIDPNIDERIWYANEPICNCSEHSKGVRWIRKQRSIQRRQTVSWLGRPVKFREILKASKERTLSEEQKAEMRQRLDAARAKRSSRSA